jgi:hypothetical protein
MPLSLLLMVLMGLWAGCGSSKMTSHWRTHDVIIDGVNNEWQGLLTPLDDNQASIAFVNDDEYLYVGLITTNHGVQRQLMGRGVTFWFDRDGGSEKKFGVRYPLGFEGLPPSMRESREEGEQHDFRKLEETHSGSELEIHGPGRDEQHRMTFAETGGIDVRFHLHNDTLVYELKVPLADKGRHPFAIETSAGSQIGIGVGAPDEAPERKNMRDIPGGNDGGEGRPEGEGFGSRRGFPRSEGEPTMQRRGPRPEPFEFWVTLQLATTGTK